MKQIKTDNRHTVRLKTLSPLHIGVSQENWWQKGLDYIHKEDKIYLLDNQKLFEMLSEQEMDNLVAYLSRGDMESFSNYILSQNHLDLEKLSSHSFDYQGYAPSEIRPMMNSQTANGRKIYLASSSLKGSVRTAFLADLIFENDHFATQKRNLGSEHRYKRGQFNFSDTQVQKHYLGRDAKNDVFRLVRFSDFYFSDTECNRLQILNLMGRDKWDFKSESAYLECVKKNQVSEGTLQIPEKLKEVTSKSQIKHTERINPERLCEIINANALDLLDNEVNFWLGKFDIPIFVDEYLESLKQIKEIAQECKGKRGQCVLRVGSGSGWEFITGAWTKAKLNDDDWNLLQPSLRKKDYSDNVPFPKTRKLTQNNEPLGFLKMDIF